MDTNVIEPPMAAKPGEPAQHKKRPHSAVTSGRKLLNNADPNSAWSRRYRDLMVGHISDLGGKDILSAAQLSLCRRAAAMECECELMEAKLSNGVEIDLDRFTRTASHLRRILESLGLQRVAKTVPSTLRGYITAEPKDSDA
jgi:hypothetical protein